MRPFNLTVCTRFSVPSTCAPKPLSLPPALRISDRFYDDVDEMRAFMSMFMELVGMFGSDIPNGCASGCKRGHVNVPSGERRTGHIERRG